MMDKTMTTKDTSPTKTDGRTKGQKNLGQKYDGWMRLLFHLFAPDFFAIGFRHGLSRAQFGLQCPGR